MPFLWNLLFIPVLISLNAFFVAVEFAVVSLRRNRIELLADEGNRAALIIKPWLENHAARDRLIAAAQLGITIVSLALGAVGENTFQGLLEPYFERLNLSGLLHASSPILAALPLLISLVIVTSLHVILGEQVPKVATLYRPEHVALLAARPMQLFITVFKWFIDILNNATKWILSIAGLQMVSEHSLAMTINELKQVLTESEEGGVIESPDREMLHAIFDLGELVVRQVMMPRTEIIAFEADMPLDQIIDLTTKYSYTKFPVYEGDIDQVIGVVHVKELIQRMKDPACQVCTARDLARETLFVPESIPVKSLLKEFRQSHQHLAIVLDEFGGTAGLVTLEDLLEEIVGEVSAPFDTGTPEIQHLPDGSYLIDGLTQIEDVNQELNLELEEENYDTIAGYVLGQLGRIPSVNDTFEKYGLRFEVVSMDGKRIECISLKRLEEEKRP
jgi:putative hemolysin